MFAITLPEVCSDPGLLSTPNLTKSALRRFGSRMRRKAARGACYACSVRAVGVAPDGIGGRSYSPRRPYVLRPACARHQWAEWLYRGAQAPRTLQDEPAVYVATSTRGPLRAFKAGFAVTRQDTGEVVLCGDGEGASRTYWNPRTGQLMLAAEISPAYLAAVDAGESAVWACYGQEIARCCQWTDFPEWAGPCPDGAEDPAAEALVMSEEISDSEQISDSADDDSGVFGLRLPEGFSEAWREVSDRNVEAFMNAHNLGAK